MGNSLPVPARPSVHDRAAASDVLLSWNVELGRWFGAQLAPIELTRSYARPSRRQSTTPDIPRPRLTPLGTGTRTFGVVLDTSGSMDRGTLSTALGSIAGYALTHDVGYVRLVFCDAEPHDRGYVRPEALLDWVDIRGRGGTILQGAIDLLEQAPDFPLACPILVITDGLCDVLTVHREHAFLLPPGHGMPFASAAQVFEMT